MCQGAGLVPEMITTGLSGLWLAVTASSWVSPSNLLPCAGGCRLLNLWDALVRCCLPRRYRFDQDGGADDCTERGRTLLHQEQVCVPPARYANLCKAYQLACLLLMFRWSDQRYEQEPM